MLMPIIASSPTPNLTLQTHQSPPPRSSPQSSLQGRKFIAFFIKSKECPLNQADDEYMSLLAVGLLRYIKIDGKPSLGCRGNLSK